MIPTALHPTGFDRLSKYFSLTIQTTASNLTYGFIPSWNPGGYCHVLDWGDGTSESAVSSRTILTHTYSAAGTYKILISASCTSMSFGTYSSAVYAPMLLRCNYNWDAIGLFDRYIGNFSGCTNLQNLPDAMPANPAVTSFAEMFASCRNIAGNINRMMINIDSYPECTSIGAMFVNISSTFLTGSVATFMRKFPKVSNVSGAFSGSSAVTLFGANDYCSFVITTTEPNQTWGFTATTTAGTWYCADWGDWSVPYYPSRIASYTSGSRVEHTFASPGTYTVKLAMNCSGFVPDSYDSTNGNWSALGLNAAPTGE